MQYFISKIKKSEDQRFLQESVNTLSFFMYLLFPIFSKNNTIDVNSILERNTVFIFYYYAQIIPYQFLYTVVFLLKDKIYKDLSKLTRIIVLLFYSKYYSDYCREEVYIETVFILLTPLFNLSSFPLTKSLCSQPRAMYITIATKTMQLLGAGASIN